MYYIFYSHRNNESFDAMIKLGKLTDYAIVVMGQLAQEDAGASCSAHYLSGKTAVPEPTVAKVLKLLSGGGLLVATRGAAGGYKLSKPAGRISIAEIITALDGPISIVSCAGGQENKDCAPWPTCSVKGNWSRVNDAIKAALEGVKLTEMISPSCGRGFDCKKDVNADRA